MKTLSEVLSINYHMKAPEVQSKSSKPQFNTKNVISHTPSKHLIVKIVQKPNSAARRRQGFPPRPSQTTYHAFNPRTKKIDMTLSGKEKRHSNGSTTFRIGNLAGRKGSEIKAHDFYHHLMHHHNIILQAGEQSEGGMKVWQALKHKHKDVNIHGWHSGKRNEYDSKVKSKKGPVDIRTIGPRFTHDTGEHRPRTAAMELVAHIKGKQK